MGLFGVTSGRVGQVQFTCMKNSPKFTQRTYTREIERIECWLEENLTVDWLFISEMLEATQAREYDLRAAMVNASEWEGYALHEILMPSRQKIYWLEVIE